MPKLKDKYDCADLANFLLIKYAKDHGLRVKITGLADYSAPMIKFAKDQGLDVKINTLGDAFKRDENYDSAQWQGSYDEFKDKVLENVSAEALAARNTVPIEFNDAC